MDKFFKWFTIPSETSITEITWFADRFDVMEFEEVDKMFALFLRYCADLGIVAQRQYFKAFLDTDGKKLIKAHKIRLATMDQFNYDEPASLDEAFKVIAATALEKYEMLVEEDLTDRVFKVDMNTFMDEQKRSRVQRAMAKAFPMLTDGSDVDELMESLQYDLMKIGLTYNKDYLVKLDFMKGNTRGGRRGQKMKLLFKTGLPCVDGDIGGLHSKQIFDITGQPGAGKTRLAMAHFAYPAAVLYKIDVLFDEMELTAVEVENMFIAHHISKLYPNIKIPDKLINEGDLTAEQERYVEAARIDLFESEGKYGKIIIREERLIVEKIEKDIYSFLRSNKNCGLWVIDYAGLAKSIPVGKYDRPLIEFEAIGELYKISKEIAKKADIGVLILNQYNEKGIEAAYAGKKIRAGHVQGGQIIQRHSDYSIAMTMTEEQEIARMRALSTIKKRAASGFSNVPYKTDLSISNFIQLQQTATN